MLILSLGTGWQVFGNHASRSPFIQTHLLQNLPSNPQRGGIWGLATCQCTTCTNAWRSCRSPCQRSLQNFGTHSQTKSSSDLSGWTLLYCTKLHWAILEGEFLLLSVDKLPGQSANIIRTASCLWPSDRIFFPILGSQVGSL